MTKSIEDILKKGYGTWRKNISMGLPFLFCALSEFLILIASLIISIIILGFTIGFVTSIDNPLLKIFIIGIVMISFCTLVIVLLNLTKAFFLGGAVGMARTAIETGNSSLSDMIRYGKSRFKDLFIANMIIFAFSIAATLLFIPAVVAFMLNMFNLTISLVIITIVLLSICQFCITLLFIMLPYSVVIKNLDPVNAVRDNYRVIMNNKISVLLLFFVSYGVIWGVGLILDLIFSFFGIIPLIGAIINLGIFILYALFLIGIVTPLTMVWWVYLYLDRTGIKPAEIPEEIPPEIPAPIAEEQIKEEIQGPIYI